MKADLTPGKYIVAVSGGVDSVVLLDILSKQPRLSLIIAHFDHGIRPESAEDAHFVAGLAKAYKLPYETKQGKLGPAASEETARRARYNFLNSLKSSNKATAVITAHHQDDLIETGLINILRGTGPQGLVALTDTPDLRRPLLGLSKRQILNYAANQNLSWREDSTNQSSDYLRNYLRHKVTSKMTVGQRKSMLLNIEKVANNHSNIENIIATISHHLEVNNKLDRRVFSSLPVKAGNAVLVNWFKSHNYRLFDRKTIGLTNTFIRTAQPGTSWDISRDLVLSVDANLASITIRGR